MLSERRKVIDMSTKNNNLVPNTLTKMTIDGKECLVAIAEIFDTPREKSGTSKKTGNDYKFYELVEGMYTGAEFAGHDGEWTVQFQVTQWPKREVVTL
tara:strand:+ start:76 stop:369 length:294 start_codon:yes stop_codon:yes gene_type:complete